jgi:hypothetical protein
MKKILFFPCLLLIIGTGCVPQAKITSTQNTAMKNKCFAWSEYQPEKKSWRWMSKYAVESGKGGYFPSREEAIDNCLATFNSLDTK